MIDTPAEMIVAFVVLTAFILGATTAWGKATYDTRPYQDKEDDK